MVELYVELFITQGANFYSNITITNSSTNTYMNLASSTFRGRLRKSYISSNIKGNLVCTLVDSANGVLQISMDSANTANMAQGRYVYSVKMKTDSETVPVIGGAAFVLPDV